MKKLSISNTVLWISFALAMGFGISSFMIDAPRAVYAGISHLARGQEIFWERASAVRRSLLDELPAAWRARTLVALAAEDVSGISAEAYIVGDLETGEIVLARGEAIPMPIASVSKLFTDAVSRRVLPRFAPVKVDERALAAYGTAGNLVAGESLTPEELSYPLLLESSNDAAEVLANGFGRDRFMTEMNELAARVGLRDTSFEDPSGLSPRNISSAQDLFAFTRYLWRNEPTVFEVTRTRDYTAPRSERNRFHRWLNAGYFAKNGDPYYRGGKTGYTPEAAQTGIAIFSIPFGELETRNVAVVVLRSATRNKDTAALLDAVTRGAYVSGSRVGRDILAGRAGGASDEERTPTSLVFVGDIMMDRGVRARIEAEGGDYSSLVAHADYLSRSDIAFGNLEGALSNRGYDLGGVYSFRMDTASLRALTAAGFDVMSVANNHAGDWGRGAFEDTLSRLREAGIETAGGGFSRADAERPRVIERGGTRFGFLAFSDIGPKWLSGEGESSFMLSTDDPRFGSIISDASLVVDVLVTSFHFGEEYQSEPTERQRAFARAAIDAGARVVIGHHPHVIQPLEEYHGGVIAYSLGNFIFDQNFSEETRTGLVLEILFQGDTIIRINPRTVKSDERFRPVLVD